MKKSILLIAGLMFIFTSCNHQPYFEGLEEYTPGNLAKLQLTFDGSYTGNNAFNMGEDNADDPNAVAKVKIEEWLNDKYYSVEKGSEATIKYNIQKKETTLSKISTLNVDFERSVIDAAPTQISGWVNFLEEGNEDKSFWVDKAYNGNIYTQCGNTGTDTKCWFISPKILISKGDMLSFDVTVGYYKGDVLSVLISTDYAGAATVKNLNKASWIDVTDKFKIPQEPTNKYGTLDKAGTFDLSEYAGRSIYLAFKYTGSVKVSTTVLLDNIEVSREESQTESSIIVKEARAAVNNNESKWTVTLPSEIADVVLDENFESGKAYDKVAVAGWLNAIVQGTYNWEYRSFSNNLYTNLSANKHEGALETWLVTPAMNLQQDMVLKFDTKLGYYNGDALSLMISEDFNGEPGSINTATWDDLTSNLTFDKSSVGGYDVNWTSHTVDLSAYTGKVVYIGFKYLGNGTKGDDLCSTTYQIDNVYVGISK